MKKLLAGNISGERIREQRLRLRLSQSTLAARVQTEGVILEQGMISRIESGDRIVTDYELRALAKGPRRPRRLSHREHRPPREMTLAACFFVLTIRAKERNI